MYNFKKNKETKAWELVMEQMNVHSSVIATKQFDEIFTREYARYEYFNYLAKDKNDTISVEDLAKMKLLETKFSFNDVDTESNTIYVGLDKALKPLLVLTLFAHGKILEKFTCTESGDYIVIAPKLNLGLSDFYNKCKALIPQVETGAIDIETAIKEIKPLYKNASTIINQEAKDKVCKKWTESTKEKCVRAFVLGLLSRYKITRSNRIKSDSPLKSQTTFEKYFAMWLVTGGVMVAPKQTKTNTVTFASYLARK